MAREFHVTSPPMKGPDVFALQQRLLALNYQPGVSDGVYGPTTESAVRAFQREHHLDADGVVGPNTFAALETATPRPDPKPSELGLKALAEAKQHLGIKEAPPNSNRQMFGEWFGANGYAWCNMFVSYCFQIGAGYTIADGYPGGKGAGVYPGKGCSYVPTTEAWLRTSGMWIGRSTPLPGDIAIYNWNGGEPDHIGIVNRVLPDGSFEAIEGNTAEGNDSDGGEVMLRIRHLMQVDGFGRLA